MSPEFHIGPGKTFVVVIVIAVADLPRILKVPFFPDHAAFSQLLQGVPDGPRWETRQCGDLLVSQGLPFPE